MKKYEILSHLIIFLLLSIKLFSYNYYPVEKIKTITIGEGKEQLGHSKEKLPSAGYIMPKTFNVYNEKIFVHDPLNSRMQIYDLKLNHIFSIFTPIKMIETIFFEVAENGDIYSISHVGFIHIDKNGNILTFTEYNKVLEAIKRYNFFIFKNQIISYNNDKTIYNAELAEELRSNYPNTLKNDKGLRDKYDEFIKNNNFIIKGNRFLNTDAYYHIDVYFTFIRNNIKEKSIKDRINLTIETYNNIISFLGFDKNDNVYWQGYYKEKPTIFIYSKYGELLDSFYDPVHLDYLYTTRVDESTGDVYHWDVQPDGVTFYRTKNTWDPIDTTDTTETTSTPKALTITATSFVDWKNTYTPAKAFDNNLTTGWLEAAEGPGKGESVTLTLDREIAVDEIHVAPGYFDPKWWKSNNRVKGLRIKYGSAFQVFYFKDEMKMQEMKLPSEIQFSGITFEITDVYMSGKDNDTGISEIAFYRNDRKVEIDVSGVK
ncbi:MAG: hypothetical protein JXB88_20540 [Spirochaetales bacterium]|nr:hypothetical protein [Spirochaetales bacterium]